MRSGISLKLMLVRSQVIEIYRSPRPSDPAGGQLSGISIVMVHDKYFSHVLGQKECLILKRETGECRVVLVVLKLI